MTINKVNWNDLDGHDHYAADSTFMNDEFTDQIERRFRAITYKNATDTNGVASGLNVAAVVDAVVIGTGVAYDNSTRSGIALEEAVTLEVVPADVNKYIVIEFEAISGADDPVTTRMEANPETGVSTEGREVYQAKVSLVASPSAATQVKLGKITAHTLGEAPEINLQGSNRQIMALGTAEGALTATPFIVVALDGSGDYEDIQLAVDSLPNTGGDIFIKAGRYRLKRHVAIQKNGVHIQGAGAATQIIVDPPPFVDETSGELQSPRPATAFLIGDDTQILTADPDDSSPGPGSPAKYCILSDMYFDTVAIEESEAGSTRDENGIRVSAIEENTVAYIRTANVSNLHIENCVMRDTPQAAEEVYGIQIGDNSTVVHLTGCDIANIEYPIRGQILTRLFGNNRRIFCSGCRIAGQVKNYGIELGGTDASKEWGIFLNMLRGEGGAAQLSDGVLANREAAVMGNVITSYRNAGNLGRSAGSRTIKGNAGAIAVGNSAVDSSNYGVNLSGAKANMVWGNNLRNSTLAATEPATADESNVIDKNVS